MKNYPMQYADREIFVEDALEVLDEGEFITVATVDDDGMPYCVPLSYVVERGWGSVEGAGEGEEPVCRIYIHTTKNDGHKMADWRRDARVWGSVACEVEPCYEETFFTTRFASAMVAGRIRHVESSLVVRKMLVALCMKYMPSSFEIGGAIEREFDITDVWCIDVERITGQSWSTQAESVGLWVNAAFWNAVRMDRIGVWTQGQHGASKLECDFERHKACGRGCPFRGKSAVFGCDLVVSKAARNLLNARAFNRFLCGL